MSRRRRIEPIQLPDSPRYPDPLRRPQKRTQQSGGGGDNPVVIDGDTIFWYDLSQQAGADGSEILLVPDLGGEGNDMTRPSVSTGWTLKQNIKNGLTVGRNNPAGLKENIAGLAETGGKYTFHLALNYTIGQTGNGFFLDSQSGNHILFCDFTSNTIGWFDGTNTPTFAGVSGWQVLTWVLNPGTGTGQMYRNGTLLGTGNYISRNWGPSPVLVGTFGAANFLVSDIGEMIGYRNVGTAYRDPQMTYLVDKWL